MAPWSARASRELAFDAYPDLTFTGGCRASGPPAVNTATRAFRFEALVPNKRRAEPRHTFISGPIIESGKGGPTC